MNYGMRPIALVFALLFGVVPAARLHSLPAHAESSPLAIPRIAIGEVAWAGSSRSTADEWIELWNLGSESVDLSGWTIDGAAGSSPFILPSGSTIAPQGAFLVANYGPEDTHSVLASPPSFATTAVSLPNTGLKLTLRGTDGTAVDQTPDGSAPAAGSSKDPKRSMVRNPDGTWTDATTTAGFDMDVTDLGTPGTCDLCAESEDLVAPTTTQGIPETLEINPPQAAETSTGAIPPPEATAPPQEAPSSTPIALPQPTPTDVTATATSSSTEEVADPDPTPQLATDAPADPVAGLQATASTTAPAMPTESATATSTSAVFANGSTTTASVASMPEAIACERLRIQEVHPNPLSDHEWIELVSIDAFDIRIDSCVLRDAAGVIATIPTDTILAPGAIHVVALASSRLNNSGDSVSIGTMNAIGDQTTFGTAPQGKSWGLVPGTASWEWMDPTPGTTNPTPIANDPQPESAAPVSPGTPPVAAPAPPTVMTAATTTPVAAKTPQATPVLAPAVARPAPPAASKTPPPADIPTRKIAAAKIPTAPTSKSAPKKTAAKAPAVTKKSVAKTIVPIRTLEPWPESFSAFMDLNPGIVVRLRGRVATPPRLISSHAFILTAPDGRGISVSVPSSQRLPEFGASVEIVGTLSFDTHDTPRLSIKSGQSIRTLSGTQKPETPRTVELLAPSLEDAWSLVSVSGTVMEAKGTRIRIETDGVEVSVLAKAQVGYRAARLNPGDTVRIRGVLDINKDDPEIVVRTADDIQIIAAAPKAAASGNAPAQTAFPGWTPFGTAIGAIGTVEGIKRAGSWRKQRKLLAKMERPDGYAKLPTIQPTATPNAIAAPPIATMRNP